MSNPEATVAAIDCGTNSIKLLIGTVRDDGRLDVALRESRVVRLGQGVDRTGVLADEALERTFAAIDEYAEMLRDHGVPPERVRFCATSATRDASNAAVFAEGVRRRLGIEPEVLSGDEEAALVYAGAIAAQVPMPPEPVLVVDIGGGSTELVLGQGGDRQAVSMDIGSVRLHERHLHADPPTAEEVAACVADIDRHLDDSGIPLDRARTVIGTSGTIKTIACGVLGLASYDREAFDQAVLPNAATASFVDDLLALTVEERRALPYMHPGRADVIGAGALIWSRILDRVPVIEHVRLRGRHPARHGRRDRPMSEPVLLPHPVVGGAFTSPVAPGTGWPDDPAAADTPVARDADDVRRLAHRRAAGRARRPGRACARRAPGWWRWREDVAVDKRASFADQPYWGRPISGWGDPEPSLLIVGLAPAANGGNRTGRIFTGDPSADWLFASLHRTGWAVQETSQHAGDGQRLVDARMVATVRCAPPENKPTAVERDTCAPWIAAELALLPTVRVVVALGSFGWDGAVRSLVAAGARRAVDAAEVRPRRGGRPGRRHAARLLPPLAAQHLHPTADAGDDGRRLRAGAGPGRLTE